MKTLYVSDLDGTLLTHEERISDYSLDVLNTLVEKGLLITYATARSFSSAAKATAGLKLATPVIVYNGALIIHPVSGEIFYSVSFSEPQKELVIAELNRFCVSPVVHARKGGEDKILWRQGRMSDGQSRYLDRRKGDKRLVSVASDENLLGGNVYFFACNGEYPTMKAAHDALETKGIYSLLYPEAYREKEYWLEILPRGATKAKAVKKLKELLFCDKTVCFGDSANDSEMFDVCDEKYAVGNADEWLKAKATDVIGYCEEDGVAKWLRQKEK